MKRTAFTLLELLLVLAIIAAICGLGITSYQRQYARAQFKSGVIQVQVDLHKTRLLAMQSGEAYLFRYVPGTCVYEIAPLKTLQEVLYRIHGDAEESENDALGGSLSLNSSSASLFSSESIYSDDLFSPENIEADLAARVRSLQDSKEATIGGESSNLGGSLTSVQNGDVGQISSFGSDASNGNLYVSSNVALGAEGVGAFGTALDESSVSTNFRELNAQERSLAKENSVAWRVNEDGVIVRKEAQGDLIFTILRISGSTPSNLRTRRPKGTSDSNSSNVLNGSDFEQTGKALGGSLTSIPDGAEDGEGLGGGLNEILGDANSIDAFGIDSEEEQIVSIWSEPIIFYPDGKTSSAVLGLESVGDYSYYSEIAIRGMTGVARISSISAIPPGAVPGSSVLTREQLFRLSNPTKQDGAATATGLATSGSLGGSLGDASTNATIDVSGGLDDLNEPNILSDNLLSTEQAPGVNYGTGRRSGYNFNENASSSTNDVPLGVSLDQNVVSDLNDPSESTSAGSLIGTTPDLNQTDKTEGVSRLNGGAL